MRELVSVFENAGITPAEYSGGNLIVSPAADMGMAVRAILFGAVGTAGQRCTSLRRVFVHESIRETLLDKVVAACGSLKIGSPLEPRLIWNDSSGTGKRHSSTSGSVSRLLVMCVCTADVPLKPSPAPEPPEPLFQGRLSRCLDPGQ